MTGPLATLMLAITALLFSHSAQAGSISFGLSVSGSQLTLFNQGDSSAFYPAVFRMLSDRSWAPLEAGNAAVELAAGARMQFTWPERSGKPISDLERMQPVMVRFFDQNGVAFGQITFFSAPPTAKAVLKAGYVNGALQIEPPPGAASSIRATWVLWAREDGINPTRLPVVFTHRPLPAVRVNWREHGRESLRLNTGRGEPAVILLHETEHGYTQQFVPDGGMQGSEQRAAWLDAAPELYAASLIVFALAVDAMALHFLRRPRRSVLLGGSSP
jgi:hypothetical protein